jgi:ABC-type polysaccharide/polyol phosphate transport system ATPase subunit
VESSGRAGYDAADARRRSRPLGLVLSAAAQRMRAIEVRDVYKTYRRYGRRRQFATLKSALLSGGLMRALRPDETFDALKGVSFNVDAGATFGIIGRNGSGKSTMLKLIAGIGRPTAGSVHVHGRVSALIELGAGFHPEISGRENVYISGMMLGLTKLEIASHFDEIVAFAEIEDFIDAPVKTYSSGMYMRLGFAVAVHVNPDVLLVDEVLAVGDEAFTRKCLDACAEFRRRGGTVLLVTHSLELATKLCDEVLWLDVGVTRAQGDPKRVVDAYLIDVAAAEDRQLIASESSVAGSLDQPAQAPPHRQGEAETAPVGSPDGPDGSARPASDEPAGTVKAAEGRWGSLEVEIVNVALLDRGGQPAHVFQSGDPMEICLRVRAREPVTDFVFGVGIFNADGVCCYGTNTHIDGATGGEFSGDGEVRFVIGNLDLVDGTYKLDVAAHRENGTPYDYHRLLHAFRVKSRLKEAGIFRPPHRWTFSGGIRLAGLE